MGESDTTPENGYRNYRQAIEDSDPGLIGMDVFGYDEEWRAELLDRKPGNSGEPSLPASIAEDVA